MGSWFKKAEIIKFVPTKLTLRWLQASSRRRKKQVKTFYDRERDGYFIIRIALTKILIWASSMSAQQTETSTSGETSTFPRRHITKLCKYRKIRLVNFTRFWFFPYRKFATIVAAGPDGQSDELCRFIRSSGSKAI